MKTLVAFSGGLDSIYVLWKELTETDNEVTAVFYSGEKLSETDRTAFYVMNVEERQFGIARWSHVQKIAKAIESAARKFHLVKEFYDPAALDAEDFCFNYAPAIRTRMAVKQINDGLYDKFMSGTCRDNDGFHLNKNEFVRNESASSLMTKCFLKYARRGELSLPLCDTKYTAANALKELPQWLVAMNRSCQFSLASNAVACDQCYKCTMHKYARDLLHEGKSSDEIYDVYTRRCVGDDGTWASQKVWLADEMPYYRQETKSSFPMPQWGHSVKIGE
jgi:hypothetical protein